MQKALSTSRPYVLLTGATGLVGGLVLARLLECELPVAVLIRANRRQSAEERLESIMLRLEERLGRIFVRPVVISGDLCAEGLGVSERDQSWLAENCGSVIHSAANLLFRPASEHPHNEPYRTNVNGTRGLLEVLARAGITEWHYVSTAYIAGLRNGRILESESSVGQQFGNDYEQSKAQCELMLRQTSSVSSLTVYRPSIVIDLHPTTSMRSDQTINSAFVMFQALSQRFGLPERGDWFRRLGFSGDERKNIVTVDWVARMIAQIYRRPGLHGRTYHLTSPAGTSASELEDGFRAAVLASGLRLPAARKEAITQIDEQAAPFVAAFKPYFRDDPVFDRQNTEEAMAICHESDVPDLGVDSLRDFCLRQTKPTPPAAIHKLPASHWQSYLSQHELKDVSPLMGRHIHGQTFQLDLLGGGGGQYFVSGSSREVIVRESVLPDAVPHVRWITSTDTWDKLITGRLSVHHAMTEGLLLLEFHGAGAATEAAESQHTENLVRLISEVSLYQQGRRGTGMEVASAG